MVFARGHDEECVAQGFGLLQAIQPSHRFRMIVSEIGKVRFGIETVRIGRQGVVQHIERRTDEDSQYKGNDNEEGDEDALFHIRIIMPILSLVWREWAIIVLLTSKSLVAEVQVAAPVVGQLVVRPAADVVGYAFRHDRLVDGRHLRRGQALEAIKCVDGRGVVGG